ncbi:YjjG family noncanonical pyrimidine nucleotidase [uncultured Imperialibacter sp.]|jgi:YjjG family noncanonical pyrimidine nucleotidase|uniref:YjjG family noncanonical pyrimidine nucleotidase n=1 Tax=uncultured Imperialibacter sp. TaxID=1672639 RepID=UPI0030DBAAD4|tara:strand:- start:16711 stop:17409 length:699 start_codon:yes stop_codon:yes gene_type:complete
MGKKYKHLFFDLDHTLWDYDQNARESLVELYSVYALKNFGKFSAEQLVDKFFRVNTQFWYLYDLKKIDKEHLREERFRTVFRELGFADMDLAFQFGEDYVNLCPTKTAVMPGAIELLTYLVEKYPIHIITNGFDDIQSVKIKSSGLEKFFSEVITSQRAGARKPSPQIFEYAMQLTGATPSTSAMVGDNLVTDIGGARGHGIDHFYFNPEKHPHTEPVTLEIHSLSELHHHF